VSKPCVMIMAGGTGGHVFPALSLAGALRSRDIEVVWLGTRAGIEARLVPAAGIDVEWIDIGGLRGKNITTLISAPLRLARALWQALAAMRRHRPRVVVGLGGYVTGPGGLAAWLARRPLVIHEQNAIAGFTNRILARLATQVLEAFAGSFGPGVKASAVGNPVRNEFFNLPAPAARYSLRQGPLRVLVVGGSQGAQRLNAVVPEAVALLIRKADVQVRHQTGTRMLESTREAYASRGVNAEVSAFIEDIASAYADADLVICRAGALTVSELAAAGVAAILVPFPAAVDDHQTRNARFLVEHDAGVLLPERELTPQRLASELERLIADRSVLVRMAERARNLARPDATDALLGACLMAGGLAA
jgi:UDP-N-acetylglucosamine--N-acetylmuramyl-(pentapeptide) pyrophosphoryl-undecaprenol N-acetylglucosamine transferase